MVQTHKGITSWCVSTDAYGILTFPETVSTLICGEMQQERAGWPIPDVILIHLSFIAFLEVSTIVCRNQSIQDLYLFVLDVLVKQKSS